MIKKLTKARTRVYNINYHIVWSVKYRHPVLTMEIQVRLKEMFKEIGSDKDFIVHQVEVGNNDRIHVFIFAHYKLSISYIAKMLKEISGRKVLREYPKIKDKLWNGVLWNPSFYVETIGSTSVENI